MNKNETYLNVNDYLDLYLMAGELRDKIWQNEIIEKLQKNYQDILDQKPSLILETLWKEYKDINIEILEIYKIIQEDTFDEKLQEKVFNLRQQRMEISRRIKMEESKSKRHNY